jgi:hypothetical protein
VVELSTVIARRDPGMFFFNNGCNIAPNASRPKVTAFPVT